MWTPYRKKILRKMVELATLRDRVAQYLKNYGRSTVRSVAIGVGSDRNPVKQKLHDLKARGYVADEITRERYGDGQYVMTHMFWLTKEGLTWLERARSE